MQNPLQTTDHRCHIGETCVTIYPTAQLEDEQEFPPDSELLQLAPIEALEMAKAILLKEAGLKVTAQEFDPYSAS